MKEYLDVLQNIMENGVERTDRTGVGTKSLFAQQMRFNLKEGFPIVTTKKVPFKSVTSELLWVLEGSDDERRLAEILYGKPREELTDKNTIWTANAKSDYWRNSESFKVHELEYEAEAPFAKTPPEGFLGRVYGVQWRGWGDHTDQIADVITRIKEKPWDRRHIVSAWNPGELIHMALPPCHMIFQFYVANNELSCHMNQRSCDLFLGVPFNITSYALLTHMIAQVCDLDVGELVLTLGDAHIYLNHFEQVEEQMRRNTRPLPELWLNPDIKNIDNFTMDDIKLVGYVPHESIKATMAV